MGRKRRMCILPSRKPTEVKCRGEGTGDWRQEIGRRAGGQGKSQAVSGKVVSKIAQMEEIPHA